MLGAKKLLPAFILALSCWPVASVASGDDPSGQDFAPSISPDDRYAAFYSYRDHAGHLSDIYVVNLENGAETQITHTPDIFEIEPKWTADGKRIVFAAGPSMKELALYSIKPDGREYSLFYDGRGSGSPTFSADGSQSLFWHENDNGTSELLIHNFKSGKDQIVETGLGGKNQSPEWSEEANTILFSHRAIDDNGQPYIDPHPEDGLYEINLATGVAKKLTQVPIAAFSQLLAPDGYIYFMAKNGEGAMHVQRIPSSGGSPEQVTPDENSPAYFPSLSADGKTLFFSGRAASGDTRILKMRLPNGPVEEITGTADAQNNHIRSHQ